MPLISHSVSPTALPRCTSKILRSASIAFHLSALGSGTTSRSLAGILLLSGASSPMTNLMIGTL